MKHSTRGKDGRFAKKGITRPLLIIINRHGVMGYSEKSMDDVVNWMDEVTDTINDLTARMEKVMGNDNKITDLQNKYNNLRKRMEKIEANQEPDKEAKKEEIRKKAIKAWNDYVLTVSYSQVNEERVMWKAMLNLTLEGV